MRFFPLLLCLLCCACQNDAPAPESRVAERDAAPPIPDLVQPADPTGIALQALEFADSAKLVPEMATSPRAFYQVSTFAARSGDEALNTIVNTTLANIIAGEEAPIRTTDLHKVAVTSVKTRLLNYKKQSVDTAEVAEMPQIWELDVRFNTEVLHNANGLLTLATDHYYFTGGAHGNYATILHSFDITAGKQLSFKDLFFPDSKGALLGLLKAKHPEYANIYPTENIALTSEGVLFDFPPYDIEAYAVGEIKVVLAYAEVESLLSEAGRNVIQRIGSL